MVHMAKKLKVMGYQNRVTVIKTIFNKTFLSSSFYESHPQKVVKLKIIPDGRHNQICRNKEIISNATALKPPYQHINIFREF